MHYDALHGPLARGGVQMLNQRTRRRLLSDAEEMEDKLLQEEDVCILTRRGRPLVVPGDGQNTDRPVRCRRSEGGGQRNDLRLVHQIRRRIDVVLRLVQQVEGRYRKSQR